MQTIEDLSIGSIVDMLSYGLLTPTQGRDMACILYTRERSGKNMFSLDLFGNGTFPRFHTCADWHHIATPFAQSILPQSKAIIDEIILDYYFLMSANLLD
jgi:hypothetical protein